MTTACDIKLFKEMTKFAEIKKTEIFLELCLTLCIYHKNDLKDICVDFVGRSNPIVSNNIKVVVSSAGKNCQTLI